MGRCVRCDSCQNYSEIVCQRCGYPGKEIRAVEQVFQDDLDSLRLVIIRDNFGVDDPAELAKMFGTTPQFAEETLYLHNIGLLNDWGVFEKHNT